MYETSVDGANGTELVMDGDSDVRGPEARSSRNNNFGGDGGGGGYGCCSSP